MLRLGDSYWQAQNLVAAGRCWMIGIEILWIQSLGLQRVRILEAASQRRSSKLRLLMSLGRLLCFFLGLLVPVLISWAHLGTGDVRPSHGSAGRALEGAGLPAHLCGRAVAPLLSGQDAL